MIIGEIAQFLVPEHDVIFLTGNGRAWLVIRSHAILNNLHKVTYKDIITAASVDISNGPDNGRKKKYLARLQTITKGRVKVENEEFYLLPGNQSKLEFQLVAEGLRKIALLWQLIKNGALESGAVLFWDEPEANMNP